MKKIIMQISWQQSWKIVLFLLFIFTLQIVISYLFIQRVALSQIKTSLDTFNNRVKNDLSYVNGHWDTHLYAADTATPHPTGSGGFNQPLYILANDGFVIERSNPIAGFYDVTDFQHLLQYQTMQTITTATNETWRVGAVPVTDSGSTVGVIAVAYYNPQPQDIPEIDQHMQTTLQTLASGISVKNGAIDTSKLDVRNLSYDLSFQIVNQYNTVLKNDGRMPTFIDRSYFAQALHLPSQSVVTDALDHEQYMVIATTMYDSKHQPAGIILSAKSIGSINDMLHDYIVFALAVAVLISIPLALVSLYVLRQEFLKLLHIQTIQLQKRAQPEMIGFNKRKSAILIDNDEVQLPYASNQYYLCEAVFSHPKRRFEQDEILDRFGEESSKDNWRKVYDAMLAINKKCQLKLIVYKDKTYRLNPSLVQFVQVIK